MANTFITIAGGQQVQQRDLEVYRDLDAVAKPNFEKGILVGNIQFRDFLSCAETFLNEVSVYIFDMDNPAGHYAGYTAISVLNSDDVSYQITPYMDESYRSDTGLSAAADFVYSVISGADDFTDGTLNDMKAALSSAAQTTVKQFCNSRRRYAHKVSKLVNVNAVKNSIRQIFTWIPGERIINPEFGSMLRRYLYEPITDENQERIVAEIRSCVLRWEPRVVIDRVVQATQIDDIEENTVKIDIYYRIKGLDNQQFMYQYEYSRSKNVYI